MSGNLVLILFLQGQAELCFAYFNAFVLYILKCDSVDNVGFNLAKKLSKFFVQVRHAMLFFLWLTEKGRF